MRGRLISVDRGVVQGRIWPGAAKAPRPAGKMRPGQDGAGPCVTLEILAGDLVMARQQVPAPQGADGIAFSITLAPLAQLGGLALPTAIRARLVETDSLLEGLHPLVTPADVWQGLLPFRPVLEGLEAARLVLRLEGEPPPATVFELRRGDHVLTRTITDASADTTPEGRVALDLPERLFDGKEHLLQVVHVASGLCALAEPLALRLELRLGHPPPEADLGARVARLEAQVQEAQAQAFQALAMPLYRHVDQMAQLQRRNTSAEMIALRRLLAGQMSAPVPAEGALPPGNPPQPPEHHRQGFGDSVFGYGLSDVLRSSSGKTYRRADPVWGVLLPEVQPPRITDQDLSALGEDPRLLRVLIQGIGNPPPALLEGAGLWFNGTRLAHAVYINPRGASWNVSAMIRPGLLQPERNLLEMRLAPGAGGAADPVVGVMFVELGPKPVAQPPQVGAKTGIKTGAKIEAGKRPH